MPQKSEIPFKDTISASHIIVSFLIDEENFQTCRIFQQGLKMMSRRLNFAGWHINDVVDTQIS